VKHIAFISIGSNIGDRLENCRNAIGSLANSKDVNLINASAFYETEPWGKIKQDWFINCVIELETNLDVHELLMLLQGVEKKLGRNNTEKGGPRVIDLDILFFNSEIIEAEEVVIPHPLLHKRRFVLTPLAEIASNFIHPVLKKSVSELLQEVDDDKKVLHHIEQ